MDINHSYPQSHFNLAGQFLGFVGEPGGKLKYLRVAVETSELQIKLSKESRASLSQVLVPGDWIQVFGEKQQKRYTDELKLKAYQVNKLSQESVNTNLQNCSRLHPSASPQTQALSCQPEARILVCQKSGCLKRGGKKLCQELERALCDRGLQERVSIERTTCLKRCSSAPNMILMPGKVRCSHLHPNEIAALLAKQLIPVQ